MKENVNGDRFALYLVERWIVAKKLHPGDIDDEQEDGDFADSLDEEYLNDMELDHEIDEHEEGSHVDYQQEDEMEIDYYGNEIDRPREAQGDQEFRDQMEETVPQNPPPEVKDIPLLNSSREREQKPPIRNHNQKTFDDFPDETKNVPRFDLAPGYQSPEPPKN